MLAYYQRSYLLLIMLSTTSAFLTTLSKRRIIIGGGSSSNTGREALVVVARALTTRHIATTTTTPLLARTAPLWLHGSSSSAAGGGASSNNNKSKLDHGRRWRSTATAVEEDLDAALDDVLGRDQHDGAARRRLGGRGGHRRPEVSAWHDNDDEVTYQDNNSVVPAVSSTMATVPPPLDPNDATLLSTTHPRWVDTTGGPLPQSIIDVLSAKGITTFTPVQVAAMAPIVQRRDVIGRSRTGTGKTLAFALPAIVRLLEFTTQTGQRQVSANGHVTMQRGRLPSMLVLCPTRELARQVHDEMQACCRPVGLFTECFHGGVSYEPQARALRTGLDIVVGTPGRIMDHLQRGNLDLRSCDVAVLDEADEMLNMGFAEDVEVILNGIGAANPQKTQCLLFSATTPAWVKEIGRQYQDANVVAIDSTGDEGGARVANTVQHTAIQLPPGPDAKRAVLEDIIAVHVSNNMKMSAGDEDFSHNPIAAAAAAAKKNSTHAIQQRIFGKTIVFTQTKREADELVSGGVFKSLSAQALHGDVGQQQRDATLSAFRQGVFNVLVATDVAARGIDIKDVDLVIQFDPPRDADTYVHRSGRTGRAGKTGVSILLFNHQQARDIVRIERDLGNGFRFDLKGPPSTEAALKAAATSSALACMTIPDEVAVHFKESAAAMLEAGDDANDVVARCLAAISRRATQVQSRSLLTGELGKATIEMRNTRDGRPLGPNDVMFLVSKLSRLSQRHGDEEKAFENNVGKIQISPESGNAVFDMNLDDARSLIEFGKDFDTGGLEFEIINELDIERGRNFGRPMDRNSRGGGGRFDSRPSGRGSSRNDLRGGSGGGGYQGRNNSRGHSDRGSRGGYQDRQANFRDNRAGGGRQQDRSPRRDEGTGRVFRGRYDSRQGGSGGSSGNDGW